MNSSVDIYRKFTADEIIELIQFAPNNLQEFFENAIEEITEDVRGFGILVNEPISFCLSEKPQL